MGKFVLPDDCTMFAKSGTTEFAVISDTGGLYHQGTMLPDTSNIVTTTDAQTLENKTIGTGCIFNTETGSTASNLVNYGVSLLSYSSDAGKAYTLSAPAVGAQKMLVLNTAVAPDTTGVFSSVYTGSTAILILDNSTTYAPKLYAGFGPPYSLVELVGVTTALWGVKAAYGNAKFSTSAAFST